MKRLPHDSLPLDEFFRKKSLSLKYLSLSLLGVLIPAVLWRGYDFVAAVSVLVFVRLYAGYFSSDEAQDFKFSSAGLRGGFKHGRC